MTKVQAAKLYLKEWIDILQLQGFVIKMRLHKKLPHDSQSKTNGSHKVMIIDITLDQPLSWIEWSIAHELSHIILDPTYRDFAGHAMQLGKKSYGRIMEQYNLSENEVIEHYLRVLYNIRGKEYPPHKYKGEDIEIGKA